MHSDKSKPIPLSDDEQAIEKRVDAMMTSNQPESTDLAAKVDSVKPASEVLPPLNIFKDAKGAPDLPHELLGKLDVDDVSNVPEVVAESATPPVESAILDDPKTEAAIDEISRAESDTVLEHEDAELAKAFTAKPVSSWRKMLGVLKHKKLWLIALLVVLIAVLAVPFTRYKLLGLVIKHDVAVTVSDSVTHTPVSNATLLVAGKTFKTNGSGMASLHLPVGSANLQIQKQYYQDITVKISIPLKTSQTKYDVALVATGRQVPILVVNKLTGAPLADASVKVLDTEAKTDKKGQATVVLPTKSATQQVVVSLSGYNTATTTVQVTSKVVAANTFSLTPAGKVYFLSNLSGKLDVVKTNLDGSDRQTVLAGTGQEDLNTTSLLAARDWRYLVLKAQRDSTQSKLYLIDTATDKVTSFDESNADFSLIGWYGHYFMYSSVSNVVTQSQNAHQVIKSYNADAGQLNLLDQTTVSGSSTPYAYQTFSNFYIVNSQLLYTVTWDDSGYNSSSPTLAGKTNSLRAVQPTGQNKKDYQTFDSQQFGYMSSELYEPQSLYLAVYSQASNGYSYYSFENGTVNADSSITQQKFDSSYPTFLLSPSGNQTFWTELRDGKNTLFVGDANAQNSKQIASLSDYAPYGWYGDSYVLVSKNSSELYIMPATALSSSQQPFKLTDYYKPSQSYNGYGYGYGGL